MAPGFTFAYQPIIDATKRVVVSFEALVRGPENQPAPFVMGSLSGDELYRFDMMSRRQAIELAASLGLGCNLNLNLIPATVDEFGATVFDEIIEMAKQSQLAHSRIALEITETEAIHNQAHFVKWANKGRSLGVKFAIDDFGAGYSGLNLLAEFQPDSIKLDMILVRDIDSKGPRQAIVRGIVRTCEDLGIDIVAEGVEALGEYEWLRHEGINLFQGYFFGKPSFQALSPAIFPSF